MSNLSYMEMREEMCVTAKLIWDRRLTNAAGGNFAVRAGENRVLITPSLMSERKHCILEPKDILLIDYDQNLLEGEGELSRESDMHTSLLRSFKNISSVIHAHPFYCMSFVSAAKPIPESTEATMGRGDVGCIPWTKAYTPELAQNVYKYFDERRELAERKPIGVILPLHGVVVSGPDIYMAYSMLERIECDAFCTITKSLLPES
ncbi:L-fuculose-phosphate aldolase [Clostridia bacterium]|nr:L-fuculose-phosphate aldolase [Clostridia bacterium]